MSKEIHELHRYLWDLVSKELDLDPKKRACPYLWYGSSINILEQLSQEVSTRFSTSINPKFRMQYLRALEFKRVGLTITMVGPTVVLPGIILTDEWPEVISSPERILLQENANSAIFRSSPLYPLVSDFNLLQQYFGLLASHTQGSLSIYTDQVGMFIAEKLARRLGIEFEFKPGLGKKSYYDFVGSLEDVIANTAVDKELADRAKKARFSETLESLIEQEKYNPARRARDLFNTYYDEISRNAPEFATEWQSLKKKVIKASYDFLAKYPSLQMKDVEGNWLRIGLR